MSVWIVTAEYWEDWQIVGVYATQEAAQQAHPAPVGMTWDGTGENELFLNGLPYGQMWRIEPHEVRYAQKPLTRMYDTIFDARGPKPHV